MVQNIYKWVQNHSPNKRKRGGAILQVLPPVQSDRKKNALDVYRRERKDKSVSEGQREVSNSSEEEDAPDEVGKPVSGRFDVVAHNAQVRCEFEALSEAEKARLQGEADRRNASATPSDDTGFAPSMREFQRCA